MPSVNQQGTSSTMSSSIFIPIDLEASLGRIEDANERKRKDMQEERPSSSSSQDHNSTENPQYTHTKCSRTGITRTSSRTPFVKEVDNNKRNNTVMLKPYPISEADDEIRERKRLRESVDWSNGLVVNSPPTTSIDASASAAENADQQSMMEVTVDDFVLSAEEAGSLTDLDARTIQDEGFWETPVQAATSLSMDTADVEMMSVVPFSVTFSSQDSRINDIDNDDELTDAAPIRSVDMEW